MFLTIVRNGHSNILLWFPDHSYIFHYITLYPPGAMDILLKELQIFISLQNVCSAVSSYFLNAFNEPYCIFERYVMYMILLYDTETKSRVFTLVDVYIAQTQCLKHLCDQICFQPQNSFSLIMGLQKASQRQKCNRKPADIVNKGWKSTVGIWRLLLPSPNLSHIGHFLRVNSKLV